MAYRKDNDLLFLQLCDNTDLEILVKFLTQDKEGSPRLTEELTSNDRFKNCAGNYKEVWDLIAGELQCFGADSIATVLRGGKGVLYREILKNVCKKIKVNFNPKASVEKIEDNLLLKIIEDSLEKMTEEEKRQFAEKMNISKTNLSTAAIMAAIQSAVRIGGFASYQMALIIANSVAKTLAGRGLTLAANAGLMRGLAVFAGPIGWVITGALTLPMISGPAYRVTIPSVIQVAYMRRKCLEKQKGTI